MKLTPSLLIVSVITFLLGVGIASLVWFNKKVEVKKVVDSQIDISKQENSVQPQKPQKPIEEAWKELTSLEACLFDWDSYSPERDVIPMKCETCAFYNEPVWIDFRQRDKREVVPFLIKQFADKERTHLHVDPYDVALKGEFAVYCLQHILKTNWIELKEDYKKQHHRIEYPDNHQKLLRRTLKNKNTLKDMRELWMNRLEISLVSENQK